MKLKDFIHGDKFTEFCDYVIPENDSVIDPDRLLKSQLVFVKTDQILSFFNIVKELPFKYVIITHNSDHNITEKMYSEKPDNILHWFGQNVRVFKDDLTPIPIGVERPNISGSGDMNDLLDILAEPVQNKNLAYINFAWETNPSARKPIIEEYSGKKWVTHQKERIPFRQYLKEIREHEIIFCPPGNGWDTHRLWETLYLGKCPLTYESAWNLFQETGKDLNGILNHYYIFRSTVYNLDRLLRMDYWKQMILKTKNDLLQANK